MARGKKRRGRHARSHGKNHQGFSHHRGGASYSRALRVEALEDRRMLAVFMVNNLLNVDVEGNAVVGSFRRAVELSNANDEADTIMFSDFIFGGGGGAIDLTVPGPEDDALPIEGDLQIIGPGARKLTISGGVNSRIFDIDDGDDDNVSNITISGVTLTGGNLVTGDADDEDRRGGAIRSVESLNLDGVVISDNSAVAGGGAIYIPDGSLNIQGSLIQNNSSNYGGGLWSGTDDDDERPFISIQNSTFTGNVATGGGYEDYGLAYGGGVFHRNGNLTVTNSTFNLNIVRAAGDYLGVGGGIASWGNPVAEGEEEDPPPPTVFTTVSNSIFANNYELDEEGEQETTYDIATVGMTDDDEEPMPLLLSVTSGGYNIIETTQNAEFFAVTPDDLVDTDPLLLPLDDYGGDIDVFLPNEDPEFDPPPPPDGPPRDPYFDFDVPVGMRRSPAIDGTDSGGRDGNEQRGIQFAGSFDGDNDDTDIVDIGATEVQQGFFTVDTLVDESDLEYRIGDFSLREALEFVVKNPGVTFAPIDEVSFDRDALLQDEDPTLSPAPTILLEFGSLSLDVPVVINGPKTFELEIDANDPTPTVKNSDGNRAFFVFAPEVTISHLTVTGGDSVEGGGAIANFGDLTLTNSWIKNSGTSNAGGAIFNGGGLTLEGTTFSNNTSGNIGGALYLESESTTNIINSTFSGNQAAARGGAIYNNSTDATLSHSTITLNEAGTFQGNGIYSAADSDMVVTHTILSDNNQGFFDISGPGTITSQGYNFVGLAANLVSDSTDLLNENDPMLEPLSFDGGPTPIHRPQGESLVINAGNPNAVAGEDGVPTVDQRGDQLAQRLMEPPVPIYERIDGASGRIDIGAYELQGITYLVDSSGNVDDGDYSEGNFSLREAIKLANASPLPDFIEFDVGVVSDFVGEAMVITDHLSIVNAGVTISGGFLERLFVVDDGDDNSALDVNFSGMNIQNASAGVFLNRENLNIDDILFVNNQSTDSGGVIANIDGTLSISNSLLTSNGTNGMGAHGGALYSRDGNVTISNGTVLSGNFTNATDSDGAGVYFRNGTLEMDDVTISGNSTSGGSSNGAGLALIQGAGEATNVTLNNSFVTGNSTSASFSGGGGIYSNGSDLEIVDSIISLNRTTGSGSQGGGIYTVDSSIDVRNSMVSQNSTFNSGGHGGGIYNDGSDITIDYSRFFANATNNNNTHGGAIYHLDGDLTIGSTTFDANRILGSNGRGGAIYTDTNLAGTQTTSITNSTFSGNSATFAGAGVFNADGLTTIDYSTITNNSGPALGFGAGVASFGNTSTSTQIHSSIISGNENSDVDRVGGSFVDSIVSFGYNLIGSGTSAAAFNQAGDITGNADPLLEPLAHNGGASLAGVPMLTHAIQEGSLAINAGDPSAVAGAGDVPEFDQRGDGFQRVSNGRIDIGALESDFGPSLPADFNGDSAVDGFDFLAWQRGVGTNSATKSDGDANGDASVDGDDLDIWQGSYGNSVEMAVVSAPQEPLVVVAEATSSAPLASESEPLAEPTPLAESSHRPLGGSTPWGASDSISPNLVRTYRPQPKVVDDAVRLFLADDYRPPRRDADFGEIATSRSLTEELEVAESVGAAEDSVFDLLGSDS